MGWFDEQIKQRKRSDDAVFEEAFLGIADAVLGSKMSAVVSDDEAKAEDAIGEILKYYHVKGFLERFYYSEFQKSNSKLSDKICIILLKYIF